MLAAKAKGHNVVCAISDSYGMREYIKTLNTLYSAGADVVVPEYLVGSSIYNEIVQEVTGASKANVVLQSDDTPAFKAEGGAFKKAKGFNARKELLEDFQAAGTLDAIKVEKNVAAAIEAKATVLTYSKAAGLASGGNWLDKASKSHAQAVLKEALQLAPFIEYDVDHCVDYDTAVELVEQNYRNGNFDRAVVYSLSGTDQPDVAENGDHFMISSERTWKSWSTPSTSCREAYGRIYVRRGEVAEDEVRKPKGHQGFCEEMEKRPTMKLAHWTLH